MSNWNPHDLQHCLDSVFAAWLTGILAVGMLIWYMIIARKWWEAAKHSTATSRKAWAWLVVIFIVCSIAGYVSLTLSLFYPKFAAVLRIIALAMQNISCPMFMYYARTQEFRSFGYNERVGAFLIEKDMTEMTDKEVATRARLAVKEGLKRATAVF